MTFCVQEASDRSCHAPCHTAETTTADNAEKTLLKLFPDTHLEKISTVMSSNQQEKHVLVASNVQDLYILFTEEKAKIGTAHLLCPFPLFLRMLY